MARIGPARRSYGPTIRIRIVGPIPKTMKLHTTKALLAGAAVSLLTGFAANGASVVYNPGDLLMGFRATSGQGLGSSYVVNIGQASGFRAGSVSGTMAGLGNFTQDLVTLFGANWSSRSDLQWGIIGSPSNTNGVNGDLAGTMYASKSQASPGVAGTGWSIAGSSTRISISTTISGLQNGFASYQASANSGVAVIQTDADPYDWRSYLAAGGDGDRTLGNKDFGGYAEIEGSMLQPLSLFRVEGPDAGNFLGSLSIGSGGLTFVPVPEPSAATLGALGVLALVARRRRSA